MPQRVHEGTFRPICVLRCEYQFLTKNGLCTSELAVLLLKYTIGHYRQLSDYTRSIIVFQKKNKHMRTRTQIAYYHFCVGFAQVSVALVLHIDFDEGVAEVALAHADIVGQTGVGVPQVTRPDDCDGETPLLHTRRLIEMARTT